MAIVILDNDLNPMSGSPLRSFHDGYSGQSYEEKFYLKNNDNTKYYVEISAEPKFKAGNVQLKEFNDNGWSVKIITGERQPTEEEWSLVEPNAQVWLENIGNVSEADTTTAYPVWIRVFCPGNTPAMIKENICLEFVFNEKVVT